MSTNYPLSLSIPDKPPFSAYLWSKPLKSEFHFSGLPEKACQGCHISERALWNNTRCTSFWSILDPWLNGAIRIYWSESDPRSELCTVAVLHSQKRGKGVPPFFLFMASKPAPSRVRIVIGKCHDMQQHFSNYTQWLTGKKKNICLLILWCL